MASSSAVFSDRSSYSLVVTSNQTSQNVSANQSTVSIIVQVVETSEYGSWSSFAASWNSSVNGSGNSGTFAYDFRSTNAITLISSSKNVAHNSDGKKSIWVQASVGGGTTIGSASTGFTLVLTTIPRASIARWAPGQTPMPFTLGNPYTLNTARASTGFTHTITYKYGEASGTIGTGITDDVSWTPPLSLASEFPDSVTGNGTFSTKTYNGSTLIGTTSTVFGMAAPSTMVPTWTSITTSEGASGVAAKIGAGAFVQGISKVTYAINGAAGAYGSSITDRRMAIPGQTLVGATGTSAVITGSGSVPAVFTITDSRGRTKSQTTNLNVLAYSAPKINNFVVSRALSNGTSAPDSGTFLRVTLNTTLSSLMNGTQKNKITLKVYTKLKTASSWTLSSTTTPAGISYNSSFTVTGPFDIDKSYDVRIEVIDLFSTSAAQTTIAVASIFMHWGNGLGVNKYHENGALDVAGDTYISGALRLPSTVELSLTSTKHAFQIGPSSGSNLAMDNNEIQSLVNGATDVLNLNIEGGNITLGTASSVTTVRGYLIESQLPAPIIKVGNAAHVVTSTTYAAVPSMEDVSLTLPRACWVRIDIGAWMSSASGDLRCGVALSGATSEGVSSATVDGGGNSTNAYGNVMWTLNTYESRTASKVVKLNAGTTTIQMHAQGTGSGTKSVNYPTLTVTPIRFA